MEERDPVAEDQTAEGRLLRKGEYQQRCREEDPVGRPPERRGHDPEGRSRRDRIPYERTRRKGAILSATKYIASPPMKYGLHPTGPGSWQEAEKERQA